MLDTINNTWRGAVICIPNAASSALHRAVPQREEFTSGLISEEWTSEYLCLKKKKKSFPLEFNSKQKFQEF